MPVKTLPKRGSSGTRSTSFRSGDSEDVAALLAAGVAPFGGSSKFPTDDFSAASVHADGTAEEDRKPSRERVPSFPLNNDPSSASTPRALELRKSAEKSTAAVAAPLQLAQPPRPLASAFPPNSDPATASTPRALELRKQAQAPPAGRPTTQGGGVKNNAKSHTSSSSQSRLSSEYSRSTSASSYSSSSSFDPFVGAAATQRGSSVPEELAAAPSTIYEEREEDPAEPKQLNSQVPSVGVPIQEEHKLRAFSPMPTNAPAKGATPLNDSAQEAQLRRAEEEAHANMMQEAKKDGQRRRAEVESLNARVADATQSGAPVSNRDQPGAQPLPPKTAKITRKAPKEKVSTSPSPREVARYVPLNVKTEGVSPRMESKERVLIDAARTTQPKRTGTETPPEVWYALHQSEPSGGEARRRSDPFAAAEEAEVKRSEKEKQMKEELKLKAKEDFVRKQAELSSPKQPSEQQLEANVESKSPSSGENGGGSGRRGSAAGKMGGLLRQAHRAGSLAVAVDTADGALLARSKPAGQVERQGSDAEAKTYPSQRTRSAAAEDETNELHKSKQPSDVSVPSTAAADATAVMPTPASSAPINRQQRQEEAAVAKLQNIEAKEVAAERARFPGDVPVKVAGQNEAAAESKAREGFQSEKKPSRPDGKRASTSKQIHRAEISPMAITYAAPQPDASTKMGEEAEDSRRRQRGKADFSSSSSEQRQVTDRQTDITPKDSSLEASISKAEFAAAATRRQRDEEKQKEAMRTQAESDVREALRTRGEDSKKEEFLRKESEEKELTTRVAEQQQLAEKLARQKEARRLLETEGEKAAEKASWKASERPSQAGLGQGDAVDVVLLESLLDAHGAAEKPTVAKTPTKQAPSKSKAAISAATTPLPAPSVLPATVAVPSVAAADATAAAATAGPSATGSRRQRQAEATAAKLLKVQAKEEEAERARFQEDVRLKAEIELRVAEEKRHQERKAEKAAQRKAELKAKEEERERAKRQELKARAKAEKEEKAKAVRDAAESQKEAEVREASEAKARHKAERLAQKDTERRAASRKGSVGTESPGKGKSKKSAVAFDGEAGEGGDALSQRVMAAAGQAFFTGDVGGQSATTAQSPTAKSVTFVPAEARGPTAEDALAEEDKFDPGRVDLEGPGAELDAEGESFAGHVQELLSQFNYRRNMYKLAKEYMLWYEVLYTGPLTTLLALSTCLSLLAATGLFKGLHAYQAICIAGGLCSAAAGCLHTLRDTQRFDKKAECYREAEGTYRALAWQLEAEWAEAGGGQRRDGGLSQRARAAFVRRHELLYEEVLVAQAVEPYHVDAAQVQGWVAARALTDGAELKALDPDLALRMSQDLEGGSRGRPPGTPAQRNSWFAARVAALHRTMEQRRVAAGQSVDAKITAAVKRAERKIATGHAKLAARERARAVKLGADLEDHLEDHLEGGSVKTLEGLDAGEAEWDLLHGVAVAKYAFADLGDDQYLLDMRRLLSQVYVRQNLFVRTSQNCDFVDRTRFMLPIMSLTAAAAIVSFLATSSLVGDQGHRWNLAACIIGVVTQAWTKVRYNPLVGLLDVKADAARRAGNQYALLGTKLERLLGEHRSAAALGLGAVDGLNDVADAAALAAAKATFVGACIREVALVQREEQRRADAASLTHDPRDATVEKWLRDGDVLPTVVDQPEYAPHLLGRDDVEAALFLNNPLARLTRRIKVKALRSGEHKSSRTRHNSKAPGGETTARMRVASYEHRT